MPKHVRRVPIGRNMSTVLKIMKNYNKTSKFLLNKLSFLFPTFFFFLAFFLFLLPNLLVLSHQTQKRPPHAKICAWKTRWSAAMTFFVSFYFKRLKSFYYSFFLLVVVKIISLFFLLSHQTQKRRHPARTCAWRTQWSAARRTAIDFFFLTFLSNHFLFLLIWFLLTNLLFLSKSRYRRSLLMPEHVRRGRGARRTAIGWCRKTKETISIKFLSCF